MNFFYIFLNFFILILLLLQIFCDNNNQTKLKEEKRLEEEEKKRNKQGTENYFKLVLEILGTLRKDCYNDIKEISPHHKEKETDRRFPWIIDHIGKGLNDLGDEIECNNSLVNTSYILARINQFYFVYPNDTNLLNFLDVKHFAFGVCLMKKCKDVYKTLFEKFIKFANIVYNNNSKILEKNIDNIDNIVDYKDDDEEININKSKYIIVLIISVFIIIKIIVGIIRLIIIPKGYDKYVAQLFQKQGKFSDNEENSLLFQKNKSNEDIIDLINENSNPLEYNPFYDFSSYFPVKLRIMKFFDFFNDVMLLSTKRNRYFNDTGLEVITFMRAIIIYFLIFSGTFNSLLSSPSKDIFNKQFFNSFLIFFYKISINSLNCWIVLEAANTTYKLMKFIKSEMFEYYITNKKNAKIEIKLLIIFFKFLLLFIPKIIIFFFSFYFFYYNPKDFDYLISAKITYSYIIDFIFKEKIECSKQPLQIFSLIKNILSMNITENEGCYEFTYLYFNIFICSLIFMLIIYISFLLRNKLFDIIFSLINIVLFFLIMIFIKDPKIEVEENYLFYHFKGQNYSTKIFSSLIGFYHLGYILGFLFFHYDNIKKKRILKDSVDDSTINKIQNINNENNEDDDEKDKLNKNNEKIEINNIINEDKDNEISIKNIRDYDLSYYPFYFFNNFLIWIININNKVKSIIMFICLFFLVFISFIYLFLFNLNNNFKIPLNSFEKYYYLYEKHVFIIFFFIINIILLTNENNNKLNNLFNSKFMIAVSRSGFIITCLYYFLSYFSFCFFFIKVKFHMPTFILISIGNFLIIFISCFIINILIELPLRITVKKLIRMKIKKK